MNKMIITLATVALLATIYCWYDDSSRLSSEIRALESQLTVANGRIKKMNSRAAARSKGLGTLGKSLLELKKENTELKRQLRTKNATDAIAGGIVDSE